MSDRRKRVGVTNKMVAYIAAGVIHLVVIGLVVFNYSFKQEVEKVEAFDAEKIAKINASVIDDRKLEEQMDAIKEKDRQKKEQERRERERLEKLKQEAQKEQERIKELQDKKKQEQEATEELEAQRKAIALKKKQEEEAEKKRQEEIKKKRAEEEKKRQRELAEKRKRDAAEKARREQEEADRQRLVDRLEAEEHAAKQQEADRRAGERTATVVSKFFADIQRKVEAKRTIDPSFETWRESVVRVTVSPSGRVESVRTIESSGSTQYDLAAEAGVYAASPVPMPDADQFPDAVKRLENFELIMKHPNAR